ncbi:unnamed protein product [Fusarium graminearum]|uniref:Uncharacterized protein n=1 Tax=Gibberella zeae TaxID=5518 RepID=A0A679P205_GIBZA|nr:hypothetical protein FG05_04916 [Fusarium graminearum]KAI6757946.1 hypothetical protein HG531_003771 [Fusarium graminearum]CAF3572902.1 unnamed protein product [Fusarium graminearum]CAG1963859.1 unnamed protein product [Fusarium graminearum]CAG1990735.1 unnamed protein product [Fusarium graminearum]
MLQSPPPQGRARSNSLQQMLDLEKKLNFRRTHQGSVPPSQACTDTSIPPSPAHTPRRFELVPKEKKVPPPVRNYSAVPPPLFSAHSDPVRSESPNMIPRKPVGHAASTEQLKESSTDKPAQKTVAFVFPPDIEEKRAVCQSPTWEAYNRQKKERKEEKRKEIEKKEEEKRKEKERDQTMSQALEEAWKNAPKPRGRKLSKPPPPSPSVFAAQGRSVTEPVQPTQKRRSRSSSLLGFSIGRNNDDPEEPKRSSRSSSLSSIFRKSFEIKRASFDETGPTGFLGGVKLEKKKEDFHQKVLQDQAKGDNKVHPAMRKSFLGHGSFTPLKVNAQKEADAQKRAYPPISINTSGMGQAAKPQRSPGRRGSVNIYLWSARARRNSVSSDCAVTDTEDEGDQNKVHTPDSEILYHKAQGLNRRGGLYVKKDQNEADKSSSEDKNAEKQATPRTSNTSLKQSQQPVTKNDNPPKQDTITVSRPPIASAQHPPRRSSAASGLSIPPTPPRKSSKRRGSLTLLTRLNHSQPSDEPSTAKSAPVGKSSKEKLFRNNPPSIRYEQTQPGTRPKPITADPEPATTKWNLKEAARSAFGRGHSAQGSVSSTASNSTVGPPVPPKNNAHGLSTANAAPIRTQHVHLPSKHLTPPSSCSPTGRRPMTSSSESSYSDAILTVSPLSTPRSTPPQSEMGHSPRMASSKKANPNAYWSYANSPRLSPNESTDADVDPIQEAANRVMEAFSNANIRSSTPRKQTPLSCDERSFASTPTHALKHSRGHLRSPTQDSDSTTAVKTLRRQSNLEHHQHHGEPSAKMFVECCACSRYHDMPSKLYEAMSNPDGVLSAGSTDFAGSVSMTVKCPWCRHEMSTKCCAGFAAMVYINERFH